MTETFFDVDTGMVGMIVFYLIYIVLMLALTIGSYVLRSLGVYDIAKRRGIRNPWLSWIPVADYWLLGCISDQYQYVVKGRNKSKRKVLLTLSIVMWVLYAVFFVFFGILFAEILKGESIVSEEEMMEMLLGPMLGMLGTMIPMMGVAIAVMVFRYIALYDLYTSCSPQNNVLFLVLSIVFSVTEPFFIFFNRKKDGGMPPRKAEPQYIPPQPTYQPPQEPWENNPEI